MTAVVRGLRQSSTYWGPPVTDGLGQYTFPDPVYPVKSRWEDKSRLVRSADGEEVVSSATVFVDRAVEAEGYLALGDLSGTPDPRALREAREVLVGGSTPSVDANRTLYKAMLR